MQERKISIAQKLLFIIFQCRFSPRDILSNGLDQAYVLNELLNYLGDLVTR